MQKTILVNNNERGKNGRIRNLPRSIFLNLKTNAV
jgi:hypothetical protein